MVKHESIKGRNSFRSSQNFYELYLSQFQHLLQLYKPNPLTTSQLTDELYLSSHYTICHILIHYYAQNSRIFLKYNLMIFMGECDHINHYEFLSEPYRREKKQSLGQSGKEWSAVKGLRKMRYASMFIVP